MRENTYRCECAFHNRRCVGLCAHCSETRGDNESFMARSSEPITFLLLLVCLESVKGYPGGAPDTACDLMAPDTRQPPTGHGAPRQTGASPYDVAITVPDRIAKTGQNYPGM